MLTFLFEQNGHPDPNTRPPTRAFHSCCLSVEQHHQTERPEPAETSSAVSSPFLSVFHSVARLGWVVARLFSTVTRRPVQNGQPAPLERLLIFAAHSCVESMAHCHHTFFPDPIVRLPGVGSVFSVGCHSNASACEASAGRVPLRPVGRRRSMDAYRSAQQLKRQLPDRRNETRVALKPARALGLLAQGGYDPQLQTRRGGTADRQVHLLLNVGQSSGQRTPGGARGRLASSLRGRRQARTSKPEGGYG